MSPELNDAQWNLLLIAWVVGTFVSWAGLMWFIQRFKGD